jgi:hypothetical protein
MVSTQDLGIDDGFAVRVGHCRGLNGMLAKTSFKKTDSSEAKVRKPRSTGYVLSYFIDILNRHVYTL